MKCKRAMGKFLITLFYCCIISTLPVFSQTNLTLQKLHLKEFDQSEIRSVVKDSLGFIYFFTNQGMWRFDGTSVQPLNVHHPLLPQNFVPSILFNYHNYLFCGNTDEKSVICLDFNTGKVQKYVLDSYGISSCQGSDGKLNILSQKGCIWAFDGGTMKKRYDMKKWDSFTDASLQKIYSDKEGKVYLFTKYDIGRIDQKTIIWGKSKSVAIYGNALQELNHVRNVQGTSKYILAVYNNGFIIYDKQSLSKVYEYHGNGFVYAMVDNDRFNIIVNSSTKVTAVAKSPFFEVRSCVFPELNIIAGANEADNSVLLATSKGIYRMRQQQDSTNNKDPWQQAAVNFFSGKSVRSIFFHDSTLYVGVYTGLYAFKNGGQLLYRENIYSMIEDKDHTLILGTEGTGGLYRLNLHTNAVTKIKEDETNIPSTARLKYKDGLIVGDIGKLYFTKPNTHQVYNHSLLFENSELGPLKDLASVNDNLWFASGNGLFKVSGKDLVKLYPKDGKTTVYNLLKNDGSVLLGTAGQGIIKTDLSGNMTEQISTTDGLAGNYVFNLKKYSNLLYAGTNNGLSIFDASLQPIPLSATNNPGITGNYAQEFNYSAQYFDTKSGLLIMGGTDGLVFLNTLILNKLQTNKKNRILLSYLTIGTNGSQPAKTDLFANNRSEIVIQPDENFISMKLTGPMQKNVVFRIKEISSKWLDKAMSDEISFYGLPPGHYTLQARYPEVKNPKDWLNKTIVVLPHFYQTWFFKVLLLLAASGVAYMIWRLKIQKIITEQRLRATIASDLHDEIGGALTRISMSSEILLMDKKHNERVLERISNDSKKAISSISDIIWSIDSRNDTWGDMILRMREHAFVLLEDSAQLNFSASGADDENTISQELRQNLYLIFKEAVNNTVRHNQSPDVLIDIVNNRTIFKMLIKNTTSKINKIFYSGQGLNNIAMRSKRIKASLDVQESGGYFTITLIMPK
jgi:ligand-binding sensor domain-containing protein